MKKLARLLLSSAYFSLLVISILLALAIPESALILDLVYQGF